jgi:hypothetical protein
MNKTVVVLQARNAFQRHCSFLVSISRNTSRGSIRGIYPMTEKGEIDLKALQHLTKLKPEVDVLSFLHGCHFDNPKDEFVTWDMTKALAYKKRMEERKENDGRKSKHASFKEGQKNKHETLVFQKWISIYKYQTFDSE